MTPVDKELFFAATGLLASEKKKKFLRDFSRPKSSSAAQTLKPRAPARFGFIKSDFDVFVCLFVCPQISMTFKDTATGGSWDAPFPQSLPNISSAQGWHALLADQLFRLWRLSARQISLPSKRGVTFLSSW